MMDGGNAQLALVHGEETTAAQLHAEMCKELNLNEDSSKLFAIWICSERLSKIFFCPRIVFLLTKFEVIRVCIFCVVSKAENILLMAQRCG